MKKILLLVALFVFAGNICSSYADDEVIESWKITSVAGEVFALDTMAQTITIKWLQNYVDLTYDEMVFKVPSTTRILKGEDKIELSDVNVGDMVAIRYYLDKYGFQKVLDITVSI